MPTYDANQCFAKLTDAHLKPICGTEASSAQHHCDDAQTGESFHATCMQSEGAVYTPVQATFCRNKRTGELKWFPDDELLDRCDELRDSDKSWSLYRCYCCCACFAQGTPIAVPGGMKAIEKIEVGEAVNVGKVVTRKGRVKVSWSKGTAVFSRGTTNGIQQHMVYLYFTINGEARDLIATPDQVFMTATGHLTTAERLIPGDRLLTATGDSVELQVVSTGRFTGGVHHISANSRFAGDVEGHLINANGLVAGDYALQLHFNSLEDKVKSTAHAERPSIVDATYEKVHAHLAKVDTHLAFAKHPTHAGRPAHSKFRAYLRQSSAIPVGAAAFLTPAQSEEVLRNGAQVPLSNPIPGAIVRRLFKQLTGLFPDILFAYDEIRMEPNVYAFEEFDRRFVLVTGGLARVQGFSYEGLALAIGHGIGRFHAGEPLVAGGLSATGQADLFAFGAVSQLMWWGEPSMTYTEEALNQFKLLFDLIKSPDASTGNPNDRLNDPGIPCRLRTIKSGFAGGSLPECAGGAARTKLAIEQGSRTPEGKIKLVFNLGVLENTAFDTKNYVVTPAAPVTQAAYDGDRNFVILLDAALKPGTTYTVTARDLESISATVLDPAKSSVTITA